MRSMEKHIYFVRHGQSEENRDRVYGGHRSPLTEEGNEQATAVAERIERIGVEALISSPFLRAFDTAKTIGGRVGLVHEQNELFGEWMEPSHFVGKHRDHPDAKDANEAILAATDNHDYRHTDEETFTELVTRATSAIRVLEDHSAERMCVVTHGGFLRVIIGVMTFGSEFTKKDFTHFLKHFYASNTGVTYTRNVDEETGWQLITWNDQSHLG